jgi:Tfp pilus assembly protein PilX
VNTTSSARFPSDHPAPARRMIGVVLPIVLVILTVLTGLVVTQVRRNTVDERMAGNARETVQLDSAVQSVLRWCEARMTLNPNETVTVATASAATAPAWRQANSWLDANSLDFSGVTDELLGVTLADAGCVIEEATCELAPPISDTGQVTTGCNGIDPRWRKFRITARVSTPAADLAGGRRFMFAQSELRLFTD